MSGRRSRLKAPHLKYLLSPDSLKNWEGLSLKDRCTHFHRVYPDSKVSPSALRKVYKANKITYKQPDNTFAGKYKKQK